MEFQELKTHIEYIRKDIGDIKNRLIPLEKHVFFINTLFKVGLGSSGAIGAIILVLKIFKG